MKILDENTLFDCSNYSTNTICNCSFDNKKGIKNIFTIKKIGYKLAMNIVVNNHYLKRTSPCSRAYGLFCNDCLNIIGVVVYGIGSSSTLLNGICGVSESKNIYELTRLWIKDGTPKNTESYLIGNTIRLLDKEIIVSFADTEQGHLGTVYQATNFMYCGLSAKFKDPKVKGLEHKHHSTYAHRMTMQQLKDKYGDENVYYADRPRKHRYIFFNAKGKRKKELISKLKYPVLPYPKSNNDIELCDHRGAYITTKGKKYYVDCKDFVL